ncbi:MAG: sigma-54-dependent Fis family transcriptional regulator [Planctomycetes bacterium]|nr:sigma-54-dependent Fis family transcriptional regulator [Planctomycetota bacterium]
MQAIRDLLQQDGFLRALFNSVPCGVLVVDAARRVQAINNLAERTFYRPSDDAVGKRAGEAIGCVNVWDTSAVCGGTAACDECRILPVAQEALAGRRVLRKKAPCTLVIDGQARDLVLLISAAPISFAGEQLAIVMLEDITELERLRARLVTPDGFAGIIGRDKRMLALYETIRDVADARVPVLIQGESGTGKELVAAAIHHESARARKNFVPVNCAALPEGLLESELFGHVRGAFTGAFRDKKGRFELADGGTIFLDEVADLTPVIQVKLLRVLQEGTFEPVGGETTISVTTRVVSATNKDLRAEVVAGRFREDLFYRLCVVPIELSPLRDRRGDIPLLAEHILRTALVQSARPDVRIAPEALDAMMQYAWPGNVRELQNAIQYALIKCHGDTLQAEHLPHVVTCRARSTEPRSGRYRKGKLDAESVRRALDDAGGNKVLAARLLGIGRATLYRFLQSDGDKGLGQ